MNFRLLTERAKVSHCDKCLKVRFSNNEHLCICLLAIYISFFVMCLLKAFVHFLIRLFYYSSILRVLCIFWVKVLCPLYILKMFSFSLWLCFQSLNIAFYVIEAFNSNQVLFLYYLFLEVAFGILS